MRLEQDLEPEEARAIVDPAPKANDRRGAPLRRIHRAIDRDGIFALFGAPVAHQEHLQRAVKLRALCYEL